ncbi:MAG: ABC transporter ATP-binding protein [Erysipelotrichaceae bacterium]|jgi:putative ABC transport system ATP-binding protein|nr:ABC transporter ATP-binding protein [Erysipelotrichaceae bacterium]HPY79529.1 ABC transporter ATP-binding protein [Bacilli bacterium]HQA55597.1 ABC transporter ATP-binding protein [Bacilli bacterium]
MSKLIEMINITKDFIQGDDIVHALKETNFSAEEGELIAIIGPSGSGKSTFLTILGGLQTPTTGQVLIGGQPFSKLALKERSKVRFEKIGFILQAANLIPFLSINDQMVLHNRVLRTKPNQERIEELYTRLDIKKLQKKYPNELSGGERQRVAIAKALYHDPVVILADEPTAALDTNRAFEVIKLLAKQTKEQKKATIMVTHDERLIEFCDKVYVIVDGVMSRKK